MSEEEKKRGGDGEMGGREGETRQEGVCKFVFQSVFQFGGGV